MISYVKSSKDSTKKLLALINEFSKVGGYKNIIQKSAVFPYTNNKLSKQKEKKRKRKTVPFTIASKRIKYFGIN